MRFEMLPDQFEPSARLEEKKSLYPAPKCCAAGMSYPPGEPHCLPVVISC